MQVTNETISSCNYQSYCTNILQVLLIYIYTFDALSIKNTHHVMKWSNTVNNGWRWCVWFLSLQAPYSLVNNDLVWPLQLIISSFEVDFTSTHTAETGVLSHKDCLLRSCSRKPCVPRCHSNILVLNLCEERMERSQREDEWWSWNTGDQETPDGVFSLVTGKKKGRFLVLLLFSDI